MSRKVSVQAAIFQAGSSSLPSIWIGVAARGQTYPLGAAGGGAAASSISTSRKFIRSLPLGEELDAHRHRHVQGLSGRRELAGLRVDTEDNHRVGVLIGGEQPTAARVDAEVTRGL